MLAFMKAAGFVFSFSLINLISVSFIEWMGETCPSIRCPKFLQ